MLDQFLTLANSVLDLPSRNWPICNPTLDSNPVLQKTLEDRFKKKKLLVLVYFSGSQLQLDYCNPYSYCREHVEIKKSGICC